MNLDLESLGFTKEQILDRVVETISAQLMEVATFDEYENETFQKSPLAKKLKETVKLAIEAKINSVATEHIMPNVSKYIDDICLQQTNSWGEKIGKPVTFTEYLTQRAEAYLVEKVDYSGKDKAEAGYGFSGTQTRITHLVNKHLHYSISTALSQSLAIANSAITKGIEETVKIKLGEISANLKVGVSLK